MKEEAPKLALLDHTHLPGFTPAQRRYEVIHPSPAPIRVAGWTTKRCNRLIRPISSRLVALRTARVPQRPTKSKDDVPGATVTRARCAPSPDPVEFVAGDREWTPDDSNERPRKRVRRTYSARTCGADSLRRAQRPLTEDAPRGAVADCVPARYIEASIGTRPLLDGHRTESKCRVPITQVERYETRSIFRRQIKTVAGGDWTLFDGLYSNIEYLLQNTKKTTPKAATGAKSLFSMCLKAMPEYIAHEETLLKKEPKRILDHDDTVTSLYEDLEAYGSTSEQGWKPLREMTRAIGISYVCKGIEEGLIPCTVAKGYISLCSLEEAYDEADELCSSLAMTIRPLGKPKHSNAQLFSPETSSVLSALVEHASKTSRWDFLFRNLKALLTRGILPVDWLLCGDMTDCWKEAFTVSSRGSSFSQHAVGLIQEALRLSCFDSSLQVDDMIHEHRVALHGVSTRRTDPDYRNRASCRAIVRVEQKPSQPSEDSSRTSRTMLVSNLISALLSMNCLEDQKPNVSEEWTSLLSQAFSSFLQQEEMLRLGDLHLDQRMNKQAAVIFNLAIVVSQYLVHGHSNMLRFSPIPLEVVDRQSVQNVSTSFLRSLATCWSKLHSQSPSVLLDNILEKASGVSLYVIREGSTQSLSEMVVATAFEFAEDTADRGLLDWALEIEEMVQGQEHELERSNLENKSRSDSGRSYRWEESISEWIAKTPMLSKQRPKSKVSTSRDDSQVRTTSPSGKPRQQPEKQSEDSTTELCPGLKEGTLANETFHLPGGRLKFQNRAVVRIETRVSQDTRESSRSASLLSSSSDSNNTEYESDATSESALDSHKPSHSVQKTGLSSNQHRRSGRLKRLPPSRTGTNRNTREYFPRREEPPWRRASVMSRFSRAAVSGKSGLALDLSSDDELGR